MQVSKKLASYCRRTPERAAWLERLPQVVRELAERRSLTIGEPFLGDDVTCSWVARVVLPGGQAAVLKIAMPHFEGAHEIQGLRFWGGDPTVQLIAADESPGAMVLERCSPGTALRDIPEAEQDVVICGLLRRLWRRPGSSHPFRPLAALMEHWSSETVAAEDRWPDAGLVRAGLTLFDELPRTADAEVLLATDLHAGNVLRASREPWLVIDPKPFVGDAAYDVTQHLINGEARLFAQPENAMRRVAELAGVDYDRVRLWMFARAAAEPRDDWNHAGWLGFARAIAP